jgi:hypothetical protein
MANKKANLTNKTTEEVNYSDIEKMVDEARMSEDQMKEQLKFSEERLQQKKKLIKFYNALLNLEDNEDFKTLIGEGYLTEEKDRIVDLIVGHDDDMTVPPTYLKRDELENLADKLKSMRDLKAYFVVTKQFGSEAEQDAEELKVLIKVLKSKLNIVGE